MTRPPEVRDRTAAGLLDAAARVFAERGEAASMAEVAAEAGVGRATLYRYFPNRRALVEGLVQVAFTELHGRLTAADLDTVEVREGLARVCRGFITAGGRYAFLARVGDKPEDKDPETERALNEPVIALLERGIADGTLRSDLSAPVQFALFRGLLGQAIALLARGELGPEQASAAVLAVFLDGAARRD